jgi:hypothetical protein
MKGRAVKEDMRGGGLRRGITILRGIFWGGLSWIAQRRVEFCSRDWISTGGTGLLEVLGTGARISI